MGTPIEIGRDEARQRAEQELAKAKYQGMPEWLSEGLARLTELLNRLLNPQVTPGVGGGFNWVFLVVVLLVLAGLTLIVWKVGLPRWRPKVRDAEVETNTEVDPDEYRSAAQRAADTGDWSTAIRERFRALVRELEHRTIIDPRPGRTAMEAAGSAARLLPVADSDLHTAALLFNDVMYGEVTADARGYHRMSSADLAVRDAAEQFRHPDEDTGTAASSSGSDRALGGVG